MKAGAMFPTREIPPRPEDIRRWVQSVVECGFDHIIAADHVLGADPDANKNYATAWPHADAFRAAYTHRDVFHEPFVLFGYIAALCDLELVTGVLVLPQRQTVLVAKQAAELDMLTGGRTRLGIGVGWNRSEFEALDMPFGKRGRLMDEQIDVLRQLWTTEVVSFDGEFHSIDASGLQMLPVQQPIPLWIGGTAPVVLERIGRVGDGWYCNAAEAPDETFAVRLKMIRAAAIDAGRDPDEIGVETRQLVGDNDGELTGAVAAWRKCGISHLAIDTMNHGRMTVEEHIDALRRAARVMGLV
jgi:probable F420-dependent oxidoreductase